MTAFSFVTLAALTVVGASACTSADTLDDAQSNMRAALASADSENARHLAACQRADSMPAILAELDRHEADMAPVMASMEHALVGMSQCSGNLEALSTDVTRLKLAMADYEKQVRNAESPATARTSCRVHASQMTDIMDGAKTCVTGMSCMGMHH